MPQPSGPPLPGGPDRKIMQEMPEQDMTTALSPANAERLKLAFQQCRDMDGSLREQLEAYAAAGREIFPAYGEAVDRLVARLRENGGGENAPRPGEAPGGDGLFALLRGGRAVGELPDDIVPGGQAGRFVGVGLAGADLVFAQN